MGAGAQVLRADKLVSDMFGEGTNQRNMTPDQSAQFDEAYPSSGFGFLPMILSVLASVAAPYLAPALGSALGIGSTAAKALIAGAGSAAGGGLEGGLKGALLGGATGGLGSVLGGAATGALQNSGTFAGGGGVGSLLGGAGADTLGGAAAGAVGGSLPGTVAELVVNGGLNTIPGSIAGGIGGGALGQALSGGGGSKPANPTTDYTEVEPIEVVGEAPTSWTPPITGPTWQSGVGRMDDAVKTFDDGQKPTLAQDFAGSTLGNMAAGNLTGALAKALGWTGKVPGGTAGTNPTPGTVYRQTERGLQPNLEDTTTPATPATPAPGVVAGQGGGSAGTGGGLLSTAARSGGGATPGMGAPSVDLQGGMAPDIYPWRRKAA